MEQQKCYYKEQKWIASDMVRHAQMNGHLHHVFDECTITQDIETFCNIHDCDMTITNCYISFTPEVIKKKFPIDEVEEVKDKVIGEVLG